jgi:phosphatidylglycerophosphate synthase
MLFARRERLEKISASIGKAFSRIPISANQWTLLSLVPAAGSAYFIASSSFLLGAILCLLAGSMDLVDGAVARHRKKAGSRGAYLDTVIDRYVETIILFSLLFAAIPAFYFPSYIWVFLCMTGSMLTTYAKSAAAEKGLGDIKGGILERAERLLLLALGLVLASFDSLWLIYILALTAVLSNISALQRAWSAFKKNI